MQTILGSKASSGSAFTQALFQEYQAYTQSQVLKEVEWVDASSTARKGLMAGNGEAVLPDEIGQRAVPASALPELTAARARLMGYFQGGATQRVPAAAAKAQVAFDCWLEQAAEGYAASPCRTTFLTHEPILKKAVGTTEVAADTRRSFTINFDLGSAKLSPQALQTLKEAAAAQAQMHAPLVSVAGYTDTLGAADANLRLSRQRADAVTAELVKLGVNPAIISENALGETKLAVATGDNKAEAKNRRVEITLAGPTWAHGRYGGYAYGDHGHGWGGYYGHNGFAVFFLPGSSRLGSADIARLKQVVAAQKTLKPKTVTVVGFTDQTGSAATNARLSNERAQAVAAEIAKLGGSTTSVEARPGEVWGGAYDGRARRVEILFGY
ncbi:Outer membrane protein A precursor [Paramagnetospirillum magnetotacticum MS-1]|uniref:Outer membrane protein A n=1 Tax=Paramagnetospirillum magnetotacticum MS-1 TaxID=272627 RepID=A0A0C2YLS5_PARME|nr:Outer membrane protein A precursor [Paramagnetospirillum magnetotacticum MS-1]